jgi:putative heme-binding domain-containing protein
LQQICTGHQTHALPIAADPDRLHNYLTVARSWAKQATEANRPGAEAAIMKLIEEKHLSELTIDQQLSFYGLLYGYLQAGGDVPVPMKTSIVQHTADMILDTSLPPEARVLALQVQSFLSPSESKTVAKSLLTIDTTALLQAALVRLQREDDAEISADIIRLFAAAPPHRRAMYFQAIRNNPKRLEQFVTALERQDYPITIIDTAQRQSLASSIDKTVEARLQKLFGATINADRESLIERYRMAFPLTPDLENGKKMFVQHCSTCHKIDNVGTSVGPDISDARDQTFDKLLISILDPNRVIDANYFRYVCQTTDGTLVDGLMEESSQENIVLRLQNGNRVSVPRDEIQDLKATGVSLMPVGFEAQLSPEAMNDLIAYIKNWRYAQQQVPAQAVPPQAK